MYSIREKIRRVLVSPCPLCGLQAMGGDLCAPCEQEVRFEYDPLIYCWRCLGVLDQAQTFFGSSLRPHCVTCREQPHTYTHAITGMHFTDPGDRLMRSFKAQGRLTDAGLFARLLWRNMDEVRAGQLMLAALVPIPSGREAMLQRGLNPAGEIARELANLSGVPLRRELLLRTREGSRQKTLALGARRESARGLYECPQLINGGWIGLVDDVLTTASTIESAAQALLCAGAQGVVALVAARTLAK
jgi:predicted amidophosphoribosyltransferase